MLRDPGGSGLRHRDGDAADFALESIWTPACAVVRTFRWRQIRTFDEQVDLSAAGCLSCRRCWAFLAPVPEIGRPGCEVAGEIEFVAVAGAVQVLLQAEPWR